MLPKANNWAVIIEGDPKYSRAYLFHTKREALDLYSELTHMNPSFKLRIFKYAGAVNVKQISIFDLTEEEYGKK